jgi:hypothetical protein
MNSLARGRMNTVNFGGALSFQGTMSVNRCSESTGGI